MLNKNPEYAHLMCDPLKEIGKNKKLDEKLDNVALIGGAVLGVGLMATGVGALVGGWLLAGASDEKSYQEAADSLAKFRQARFDAILSMGFTAFESLTVVNDVARLNRSMRNADAIGDLTASEKSSAMKMVTDTFDKISKDPKLLVVMNKLKKVLGGEKFSKFVASLASLSNKTRLSVLANLAKMRPELLEADIGIALADALNMSVKSGDLTAVEAKAMGSFFENEKVAHLVYGLETTTFSARLDVTSPESIKRVDNVQVTTAQRLDIETDEDFSFYLSQMDEGDKEFTMKFIQLNRSREVPKEEIVKRLKNSVGQCRL